MDKAKYLEFHIHHQAGLEFRGEFVLVNGNFFNQPPDEGFVVFGEGEGFS